jgi:ribonuclease P protein component
MISRTHRFHGRGGITRLYQNGKSVRGGALMLRYAPNIRRKSYRVAVVVSRKVSKSAVVRNRIRRRIYERVRILSGSFTEAYDLVFVAYDEKIADLPAAELAADIDRICKKARLVTANLGQHDIVEARKKM